VFLHVYKKKALLEDETSGPTHPFRSRRRLFYLFRLVI